MKDFVIMIPARLESTRLPNKVLLPMHGKPMIEHVYERSLMSGATRVIIATDHPKIMAWGKSVGAECTLTDPSHPNGTSRIHEAVHSLGLDPKMPIVAVQADEPAINPKLIVACAKKISAYDACSLTMVTAADSLKNSSEWMDPNTVKVVLNHDSEALYFSRAAIGGKDSFGLVLSPVLKHIGIYAYYPHFLNQYISWPACQIEQSERLEQLKALYHGATMPVVRFDEETGFGVDTIEDYERMCKLLSKLG
jgi:3-deoxy-manno-octulosonate cytidylyltransferase (CMP-KDO synthetase)